MLDGPIELAGGGTAAAVLEEQRDRLLALLRARLRCRHAAEDVYQNIAVAVAASKNVPDDEGAAPWLYRVAVRQCRLFQRTAARQAKLAANAAARTAAGDERTEVDPIRWLIAEERSRAFRNALAELPDVDRQILVLKAAEGWSYRRLAETFGVTERTVEHRLMKARMRLRRLLERAGNAEGAP